MTLRAVDTPLDPDRADVVVLKAPGKPRDTEHPILGPLPKAMDWMMACRQLMRDQDMDLCEADQAVRARKNHDGRGRRFQPSGQR